MKRKSFILYLDLLDSLDELSDEQAGKLFKAIKAYHTEGSKGEPGGCGTQLEGLLDNFVIRLAFLPFRAAFERDAEKYQNIIERNRKNGAKGGRKKADEEQEPKKPSGLFGNPKEPKETQKNPEEPKKADNDNDNDNVNDNIVDVVDAGTRAREGDGFDEILTAFFAPERQGSLEQFCMNLRIDMARLRSLAEEAVVGWRVNGQQRHFSQEDAFKHLTNTIRIKLHDQKAYQRVYENNQTDRLSARRGTQPRDEVRKGFKGTL